jgi:hypothetical protein
MMPATGARSKVRLAEQKEQATRQPMGATDANRRPRAPVGAASGGDARTGTQTPPGLPRRRVGRTLVCPSATPDPAVGLAEARSWPTGMRDMLGMQEQFRTSVPRMAAIPGGPKPDLVCSVPRD